MSSDTINVILQPLSLVKGNLIATTMKLLVGNPAGEGHKGILIRTLHLPFVLNLATRECPSCHI
jgi:hypothetical protein